MSEDIAAQARIDQAHAGLRNAAEMILTVYRTLRNACALVGPYHNCDTDECVAVEISPTLALRHASDLVIQTLEWGHFSD